MQCCNIEANGDNPPMVVGGAEKSQVSPTNNGILPAPKVSHNKKAKNIQEAGIIAEMQPRCSVNVAIPTAHRENPRVQPKYSQTWSNLNW
ncbi:hypothetical protein HPP92_026273 [Vanilla planifolia]|uniref:Uncharacterized protein n=1 Tax=Vanilla planifolia TaxID=51239 RepID=A0A835PDN4_VANPL|nr:hypothetical protein HPP92_026273 [Vanilla planifolia]